MTTLSEGMSRSGWWASSPQTRLNVEVWELEVAVWLSEMAYDAHPSSSAISDRYAVQGSICTFCTAPSGQKCLLCQIQRGETSVLFCAFAGTHLPGDWERVNIQLPLVVDDGVGAPSHAGFLRRSLEVPLEGIARMKPTRLVFCGHSLGGAVAHLCRLRWLYRHASSLGAESVVSVAFGSPFFGGTAMLEHVKRHGWIDGFVTLVNGNDPIPRVMNLAANLVEKTFQCALGALVRACESFLVTSTSPVAMITNATTQLVSELQHVATKPDDRGVIGDSFVSLYVPIGVYVFFPFGDIGNGLENDVIQIELSPEAVQASLGPANLLNKNPGVVSGVLDHAAISHHPIQAYFNIVQAKRHDLEQLTSKPSHIRQRSTATTLALQSANELMPRVLELTCETLMIHESQPCRVIKFRGENLDFIGDDSITVDTAKVDPQWSRACVLHSTITRRSATDLVLEQHLKSLTSDDGDHFRPLPLKDVKIRLRSDAVIHGEGGAEINVVLHRKNCHTSTKLTQDPLSFYGGQFFLDTQQHAWLIHHLFQDDELANVLKEFEIKVNESGRLCQPAFVSLSAAWKSIEDVGIPVEGRLDPERFRDDLYKLIVPSNGLEVRTKRQSNIASSLVGLTLTIGGGIIATGGLGFIGGLLGYGASLTGGYGTAGLVVMGGLSGTLLFKNRFRCKYSVMLQDLLQVYTGHIPKTGAEMELEAALVFEESRFNENWANNTLERTNIPMYDQYDNESQKKFRWLVTMIKYIHRMKKLRISTSVVAFCGPRDSGKTTLMSQLLHRPELAVTGTGYRGGADETVDVVSYSVPQVYGYALLDTPGLTGPDAELRSKFNMAALNLASTFVYIREYSGLPTEVDLKTIQEIVECSARYKTPKILVCLNRCKEKLTEDAAGEIFHLQAGTEAAKWHSKLEELRSRYIAMFPNWANRLWFRSHIEIRFVELKGGKELEAELDMDKHKRTCGIWTAASIGKWIGNNAISGEENGEGLKFQKHMSSFDYFKWQEGYRAEMEQIRQRNANAESIIESIREF